MRSAITIFMELDNIGIDAAGGYGHACWQVRGNQQNCHKRDYARKGRIHHNLVHHIDSRPNPAYSLRETNVAPAIYVDGARDIEVSYNRVYASGVGISLSSEQAGARAESVQILYNEIYNNYRTGLNLGAESAEKGKVQNCLIAHNSFYNNDLSPEWGGEIYIEYNVSGCNIAHNLIYAHNWALDEGEAAKINLMVNDYLSVEESGSGGNWLEQNAYYSQGNATWFWQGHWIDQHSFAAFAQRQQSQDLLLTSPPPLTHLPPHPDSNLATIDLSLETPLNGYLDFAYGAHPSVNIDLQIANYLANQNKQASLSLQTRYQFKHTQTLKYPSQPTQTNQAQKNF
ncbi:MAG: right-handed parallel beta-helix repeat-containing protein [Deinococcales bacterium]